MTPSNKLEGGESWNVKWPKSFNRWAGVLFGISARNIMKY